MEQKKIEKNELFLLGESLCYRRIFLLIYFSYFAAFFPGEKESFAIAPMQDFILILFSSQEKNAISFPLTSFVSNRVFLFSLFRLCYQELYSLGYFE